MELNNFKELLLKKSIDDKNLQTLIKYMKDDYLVDHVIESLAKMADAKARTNPNDAVIHWGRSLGEDDNLNKHHMYDTLSHHASQYKAALKAAKENPAGSAAATKIADQHMAKIFKMVHMTRKLQDGETDHSGGHLSIDAVDPKPWESAKENMGARTDTKGWGFSRSKPNFDHLRKAPGLGNKGRNEYKKELTNHGHTGAYPLEEMKVNGKHIHIDDDAKFEGKFESHAFDNHPIFNHYSRPHKNFSSSDMERYHSDHDKYHEDDSHGDQAAEGFFSRDPKDQEARGKSKSSAVHDEVDRLELPDSPSRSATSLPDKVPPLKPKTIRRQAPSTAEGLASLKSIMEGSKK